MKTKIDQLTLTQIDIIMMADSYIKTFRKINRDMGDIKKKTNRNSRVENYNVWYEKYNRWD